MSYMRLGTVATIMAGIIIVIFLISAPHTREAVHAPASTRATTTTPVVLLRDTYTRGVHTITGSTQAPDKCTTASAHASLVGATSSDQHILLEVTLSDDSGVCLEVPSSATFSTSLAAPRDRDIVVILNGVTATTTLP